MKSPSATRWVVVLTAIGSAFPPERRGAAIGIFSAITGIAVASGPLVGGAVVEGIDWEWIFWLNVPIGLVAIPLVVTKMEESFGSDSGLAAGLRRRSRAAVAAISPSSSAAASGAA